MIYFWAERCGAAAKYQTMPIRDANGFGRGGGEGVGRGTSKISLGISRTSVNILVR